MKTVLDRIPPQYGSRFRFINVAAARAGQIFGDSDPRIVSDSANDAHIAIQEFKANLD